MSAPSQFFFFLEGVQGEGGGRVRQGKALFYFALGFKKITKQAKSAFIPHYDNFFIIFFIVSHPEVQENFTFHTLNQHSF